MIADFDIIVIGAGAAGVAAGLRLSNSRASFAILEAAPRVGGRAHSVGGRDMPLDLGCGWLHSADRNPWTRVAEDMGWTVDRTPPAWGRQFEGLGFPPDEQEAANAAYEAFDKRLRECPPSSDRASDALDPNCAWNSYIEARSGYINGVGTNQLSIRDYLAYDSTDTGTNWRLPDGYGALIATAASRLPVRLSTAALSIDRRVSPLRIETTTGRLSCRAVIVAVPTPVLAREQLRFDPTLPEKAEAASSLPLGIANKLFLALEGAEELAADCHMLGNPRSPETGSYYLRPFGRPLIEAFYGGAGAEALEAGGMAAMADFAAEELVSLFGSGFRRRLTPLCASAWASNPLIGGSYSHALPGQADARAMLSQPIEGRIFFAGEACSEKDFSTAHGAHDTGTAAAEACLAALSAAG